MFTISILFKNNSHYELRKIDSCYLSAEDNTWRFFNDLNDYEILKEGKTEELDITFDEDTIFIPNNIIKMISFR